MYIFVSVLLVLGLVLLIVGYRKKDRNLMLIAALSLFFSAAAEDLVAGFKAGWYEARAEVEQVE